MDLPIYFSSNLVEVGFVFMLAKFMRIPDHKVLLRNAYIYRYVYQFDNFQLIMRIGKFFLETQT